MVFDMFLALILPCLEMWLSLGLMLVVVVLVVVCVCVCLYEDYFISDIGYFHQKHILSFIW